MPCQIRGQVVSECPCGASVWRWPDSLWLLAAVQFMCMCWACGVSLSSCWLSCLLLRLLGNGAVGDQKAHQIRMRTPSCSCPLASNFQEYEFDTFTQNFAERNCGGHLRSHRVVLCHNLVHHATFLTVSNQHRALMSRLHRLE